MKYITVIVMTLIFYIICCIDGQVQASTQIRLTFANEEVLVTMYDNDVSRDFIDILPLTLTFEDYAATEKISYLDRKLAISGMPPGFEPVAGDFTYYAPWGNLAIFYRDFRYSNNLIKLGHIEQGIDKLRNMQSSFTVLIERVE